MGPSRPMAVFARHAAAAKAGASRVAPIPGHTDMVEARLDRRPQSDLSQDYLGSRPRCAGIVAKSGIPCTSAAIYLGSGTFAQHCYSHGTPGERDRYREHQEGQNKVLEESWAQREKQWVNLGRDLVLTTVEN